MELLDGLEYRPSMYGVAKGSYESVVAYLMGLDQGSGGAALAGFQELVDLKFGSPSPVGWPGLVPQLDPPVGFDGTDDDRLARLFGLLREYVCVDAGSRGRRRLYHEWVLMAQRTDHYRPEMQRFGTSPEPATISLDEAASRLGTDRADVLERLRTRELRCGRLGGDVRVVASSVTDLLSEADAASPIS